MWKTNLSFPTCCGGDESPLYTKRKMGYVKALRARTLPQLGPVRDGGRGFRTGRPDELTRWAWAGWLLEQISLPEVGTISGDIRKAPGFLKGPAGPRVKATLQKSRSLRCKVAVARSEDDAILYVLRGRATQQPPFAVEGNGAGAVRFLPREPCPAPRK